MSSELPSNISTVGQPVKWFGYNCSENHFVITGQEPEPNLAVFTLYFSLAVGVAGLFVGYFSFSKVE